MRGTNWVGDAVMQIPALRELRRRFPAARITLHTRDWARGIFQDADFIDEILVIEPKESIFAQAARLRERRFDLCLLFTNSFKTALIARLGKATRRIGYANEGRSFLLTDPVPPPAWKHRRHEVFYYLHLIAEAEKVLGAAAAAPRRAEPRFDLAVSAARRARADEMLAKAGVDPARRLVAFCPGSTNSRAKRWPAESYARLNDRLQDELNVNVVLIGAQDERDVSLEIADRARRKPVVLTGETSLAEATAVLNRCDLLVSNDTGPAHISAALGTATIVVFGPTNPLTTAPWGAEIVSKEVACAPCMLRDCPIDHRCLTRISADEIFDKVQRKLNER